MSRTSSREIDVLCVGLITVDHVCAPLRRIPAAGQLEMTDRIELAIGGSAANVGLDLRRVGRCVSIAGCVGDDVLGRHVAQVLAAEGALCDQFTFSKTAPTATTMVVNVQGDDRRFIHAAGANTELTGNEVSRGVIGRSRALYVGGFGLNPQFSGENVARLFAAAREQGVLTVLDVVVGEQDVGAMLTTVLPLTDLFLPNDDEGRAITGLDDPLAQARRFRERGARCVVITRGRQGTILLDESRCLSMPAHRVPQVDATGGGDAFVAGYVHAHLDGHSPEECLRYGSALGASCVQAPGATTGVFRAAELEAFVKANPLPITAIT
ncbi:MAG: carbohydrate kinase family protein [Planctomycetaceae bacterium]